MKHRVIKAFVNYKKEEDWLNKMAQKGMHLVYYFFFLYVFEEGESGEYVYRLELLKNHPEHPESAAYLQFMEESGVECICTWMRWVYFRKKACEGGFEIYSDREGKIKHAKRVIGLMLALFLLNFGVACCNLGLGLDLLKEGFPGFNAYLSPVNFAAAVVLLTIMISQGRIIRDLNKDKEIRE